MLDPMADLEEIRTGLAYLLSGDLDTVLALTTKPEDPSYGDEYIGPSERFWAETFRWEGEWVTTVAHGAPIVWGFGPHPLDPEQLTDEGPG